MSNSAHPPLSSRSGAEASDPVLAGLPTRFSFRSDPGVGAVTIAIGVLGVALVISGVVIVVNEDLNVVIGVVFLIVGIMMFSQLLLKIILPEVRAGSWLEIVEPGTHRKLTAFRLVSDGGDQRAGELYQIFTNEQDTDRWPMLRHQPDDDGVIVTVYRRHAGTGGFMTLRTETDEGARAWPLIELTTVDPKPWLLRILPKPHSSSDQSANMPYLHD